LTINPNKVNPGESVEIYFKITNTGDSAGTDTVVLEINNSIIASKDVTIPGGGNTAVTFTTSSNLPGNYKVQVAGLNGNFDVAKSTISAWFWLVALGGFVLGAALSVLFLVRRRR